MRRLLLVGAVALLLPACSTTAATESTVVVSSTSIVPSSTSTSTTTTPAAMSPEDVFSTVAPAVAYVLTETATGSAVMVDDRHAVTNAHVVWPYQAARVVFPDGTELDAAPVVGWDMMADLAVIDVGAAPSLPAPAVFNGGEDLPIGSEVFLVGYPAEDEEFPQPTISRGILSRVREWEEAGLTYLQTDASIAGGQSGGALVDDRGEVIGVSGLSLTDGFALALAGDTVAERAAALIRGEDVDGLGDRLLPVIEGGVTATESFVSHFADEATWVFEGHAGDVVSVSVDSVDDLILYLIAPDGVVEVTADEGTTGEESFEYELVVDGPHVVAVQSYMTERSTFTLLSSHDLVPFGDQDHGRRLTVGETLAANGDYPGDADFFRLELTAAQTVTISVTSTNIDPLLSVDLQDNTEDVLATDDDSGGGVLGTDAQLTFTADEDGDYLVSVIDTTGFGPGGYLISVEEGP